MFGYSEGRVVFDRYLDESLKNKTRQKRATTPTEFEIHPEMKLMMSLKDLLSGSKTKRRLTVMLAEGLLQEFSRKSAVKLVVIYDTKIKGCDFEENHTHEEADTLIPNQVLASLSENAYRDVFVWSPDTDVLVLLLHLVSSCHLGSQTHLKFLTGTGSKFREIDVIERMEAIGSNKCQGLLGFHNFSGADWGGKFVGISKKTLVQAYMRLEEEDPAVDCFKKLGEGQIPNELIDGELPPEFEALERLVCKVYRSSGPTTIPALRWELFRSKNLEGEMLPPTRSALLPHIIRANYVTMRDKSYPSNHPALPPIEGNGWSLQNDAYVPLTSLYPPAPVAVIELVKCGCKTGCAMAGCSCFKNGLPCTPLCKCYSGDCANKTNTTEHREEDEQEENY